LLVALGLLLEPRDALGEGQALIGGPGRARHKQKGGGRVGRRPEPLARFSRLAHYFAV
jgi:hypothetical protein